MDPTQLKRFMFEAPGSTGAQLQMSFHFEAFQWGTEEEFLIFFFLIIA